MLLTLSRSKEETLDIGEMIGKRLPTGSIICFFGDLGAGKTTLIKGIAKGAAHFIPEKVSSPTYVYLHIYEGVMSIYHFDLYRLHNAQEFVKMGFDEMLYSGGIACIEWSERIKDILPEDCIKITIEHRGEYLRQITVEGLE